jgi:NAD+ diphosphatase
MIHRTASLAFTGATLDRASERRGDAAWLRAQRADAKARILPMWRSMPFLWGPADAGAVTELGLIDPETAKAVGPERAQEVFLGLEGAVPHFARDISALSYPLDGPLAGLGHFREAREALPFLPLPQVAILGQAKALMSWHAAHGFCARCGAGTRSEESGHRRLCPACGAEHFPRTDPAVIMLVTGGDRCLLGRNRRFAASLTYSTLAGFVEPGESIEEAVRREVFEEVGVRTGDVRYFAAQPWPFPYSLMIGCYARALGTEIVIDGEEIIAARWFDRETIQAILRGEDRDGVKLPRHDAIAFHLIANWADLEG